MRKILTKKNIITLILTIALYAVLFGLVEGGVFSRHMKSLLVPIGINIILAVSLNLTVGFLGELTLGHAGFMSVGAYVGCIFSATSGLPDYLSFFLGMIVGGLAAAVVGLVIGIPVLRLKGDYLAIVTLAFGEIIRSVMENLTVTGGASGYRGIPMLSDYTIVFIVVAITIFIIANLVNSRHGRAICSIRDNVIAAESVGINVTYYKIFVFVIAAFFAGVAGVLYGHNLGILIPARFDYNKSIEILVIVVLGGMGSLKGSVIAATLITLLPEVLRGADNFRMLLYSIVLIVMMLLNASPKFASFKAKLRWENLSVLFGRKKTVKQK
ncbi:MAG: branched-chain amino acid ABC transporter permease [Clostridiales bacterium]|nr:branched-chain amino acid ABC transporter permease [Clostridiales bacterium]